MIHCVGAELNPFASQLANLSPSHTLAIQKCFPFMLDIARRKIHSCRKLVPAQNRPGRFMKIPEPIIKSHRHQSPGRKVAICQRFHPILKGHRPVPRIRDPLHLFSETPRTCSNPIVSTHSGFWIVRDAVLHQHRQGFCKA